METKTYIEPGYIEQSKNIRIAFPTQRQSILPITIFCLMVGTLIFASGVLDLRDLGFGNALINQIIPASTWPAHILFSGLPLSTQTHPIAPTGVLSWHETSLLFGTLLSIFLLYLIALRCLPQRITFRYIFISTLVVGIAYALIPTNTSSDMFSYIAYARLGMFYHYNPLTARPDAIPLDIINQFVQWRAQPSAYGPTWAVISGALQWITSIFGKETVAPMVIALRLLGLGMHLWSTRLIWLIIGHMQRQRGYISPRKRLFATLAFAWNPLLLFEACVNAHNDASVLPFVLLSVWFLVEKKRPLLHRYILCALMLALASCLKINTILLAPGILLFMWMQQPRQLRPILAAVATYVGTIILFYAPFWDNGAVLDIFRVNPGTIRDVNTPADFLSHVYNGVTAALGNPIQLPIGSPSEHMLHSISTDIFIVVCILFGLKTLITPGLINTLPRLLRWMAVIWLLYCVITPWFWPWYTCIFFGLYAVIEGTGDDKREPFDFLHSSLIPRLLTFTLLGLNCFMTWGATNATIPGLPGFQWAFLRGLWAWLPLCLLFWHVRPQRFYKATRTNMLAKISHMLL